MATADRGNWGSRLGFIFAAAGSAVGLGNIWGFPTQVGQGGGAAFVLVYLGCILLVCAPIFLSELIVGRRTHLGPVGAFKKLAPESRWWIVGAVGVSAGVGILSFYAVIAGWTLGYIWFAATGAIEAGQTGAFFGEFTANATASIFLTFCFIALTAACILGGVQSGIERVTKTLMPLLFGLLVLLAIRAATLEGASEGLAYYLKPDVSKLANIRVWSAALGQAFFSLSLGMGALIVYGSYVGNEINLGRSALWVILLDTVIALTAGLIIFPAGFSIEGFDPSASGPGLIFTVLPKLFSSMAGGTLFGTAFFVLLAMAALTSTISLLEVPVSHFIDQYQWPRKKAVIVLAGVTFLLSIPSALAQGGSAFFTSLPGVGMDFLTLMGIVWNNYALPIGGFGVSIFVGYVLGVDKAIGELHREGAEFGLAGFWSLLIRSIAPVAIFLIILATAWPALSSLFS